MNYLGSKPLASVGGGRFESEEEYLAFYEREGVRQMKTVGIILGVLLIVVLAVFGAGRIMRKIRNRKDRKL